MRHLNIIGSKGGVGATTVAAAITLNLVQARNAVRGEVGIIGYHRDDIAAIFGSGSKDAERLTDTITYGPGSEITVVDYGTGNLENMVDGPTLLVTRGCYLGLRRVVHNHALHDRIDGVILIEEPGRALDRRDVTQTLGKPLFATIPVDPSIARANDAGLLAIRTPDLLAKPIDAMLRDHVGIGAGALR